MEHFMDHNYDKFPLELANSKVTIPRKNTKHTTYQKFALFIFIIIDIDFTKATITAATHITFSLLLQCKRSSDRFFWRCSLLSKFVFIVIIIINTEWKDFSARITCSQQKMQQGLCPDDMTWFNTWCFCEKDRWKKGGDRVHACTLIVQECHNAFNRTFNEHSNTNQIIAPYKNPDP